MKKKKLFLFFVCTVLLLGLTIGVFIYFHPTHIRYNDRFILDNTAEAITQKYGAFYWENTNEAGELVYAAYRIRENTPELIMSYDDSLWYEIYFQDGVAVKVRLQKGWYGG